MDATKPDTLELTTELTDTLPLVEERIVFGKRDVVGETVSVTTRVLTETETVEAALRKEDVSVERIAHNTVLSEAPSIRTEGDTTIIPIVREELFVQKRLVLVEEVHITKSATTETTTTEVELRRTEPVISKQA